MEIITSLFGSGVLGKVADFVTIKYLTGAGLPGALMLASVAYMIFLVRNHKAPEKVSKMQLFQRGYIIADLSKIGFAFMVFIAGAIFFRWPG